MRELLTWTHPAYEKVAKTLETMTGLFFSAHQSAKVEAVTRKAIVRMQVPDVVQYLQRLETERPFLDDLAAQLTVGETYFFREPDQFQLIRDRILPELIKFRGKEHPLRSWSAGCSTGEEAYSLAILFEEEGIENPTPIQATDISLPALAKARKGVYGSWSFRERKSNWIGRYFQKEREGFELEPRFRQRVEFKYLNLALGPDPETPDFKDMDLILCRNVMIYFSPLTVKSVFRKLTSALAEGGWLMTGPSDPVPSDLLDCEMSVTSAGTVYQKKSPSDPNPISFSLTPWSPSIIEPSKALETWASTSLDGTPLASPVHASPRPFSQEEAACQLSIRTAATLHGSAEAELLARGSVKLYPLSPGLHFLWAILLMNMGRDREAVKVLHRTLYLDRTLAVTHFTLGILLRRLQDSKGASRSFENALKLCRMVLPETLPSLSDGETTGQLLQAAQTQLAQMRDLDRNRSQETGGEACL